MINDALTRASTDKIFRWTNSKNIVITKVSIRRTEN